MVLEENHNIILALRPYIQARYDYFTPTKGGAVCRIGRDYSLERKIAMRANQIEEAFARMELGQVRAFILNGAMAENLSVETYSTRLDQASTAIFNRLKTVYEDDNDFDPAFHDLSQAMTAYQEVYTEIGMKAGARLLYQLLFSE